MLRPPRLRGRVDPFFRRRVLLVRKQWGGDTHAGPFTSLNLNVQTFFYRVHVVTRIRAREVLDMLDLDRIVEALVDAGFPAPQLFEVLSPDSYHEEIRPYSYSEVRRMVQSGVIRPYPFAVAVIRITNMKLVYRRGYRRFRTYEYQYTAVLDLMDLPRVRVVSADFGRGRPGRPAKQTRLIP